MDRRMFAKKITAAVGSHSCLQLTDEWVEANSQGPPEDQIANGHRSGSGRRGQRSATYDRIKTYLDSVPSVDLHQHLRASGHSPGYVQTDRGRGMNLYALWRTSYLGRVASITPWETGGRFDEWWARAKGDFYNVRATGFYRYMWLALRDLYSVDFDRITDSKAAAIDRRIFENYSNQEWMEDVIKKRPNIELIGCDRYWERFNFKADYPFECLTFNVTTLVWGFHPSEYVIGSHSGQIQSLLDNPICSPSSAVTR